MPLKTLSKFGKWIGKQIDGFIAGVMRFIRSPPEIGLKKRVYESLKFVVTAVPLALGSSTNGKQIVSSLTLMIVAYFSAWVTLGLTLPVVVFFAIMFLIGVARLVPFVDKQFVALRDTVVPRA